MIESIFGFGTGLIILCIYHFSYVVPLQDILKSTRKDVSRYFNAFIDTNKAFLKLSKTIDKEN